MIRPLYNWIMRRAAGPEAPYVLFGEAFLEAIFLPLPPDIVMAPMILQKPQNTWRYALLVTLASILGANVSYFIGYHLTGVGQQLMALTGHAEDWPQFQAWFREWGPLVIIGKSFTPVPFAFVTVASGLAHMTYWKFLLACLVARAGRFTLTAFLTKRFGPAVRERVEKNLVLWGSVAIAVGIAVIVGVHMLGKHAGAPPPAKPAASAPVSTTPASSKP
ncbi:MAG: DedA family protein [Proteobacteria bacterium]|nr:DedA family protein [Pseudomonadota bacterium]